MANGKVYPGGVIIATPFEMEDPQPIVSYMVVRTIADRNLLPNQFKGMFTYVEEEETMYHRVDVGWIALDKGESIEDYNYKKIVDDTILF